MYAQSIVTLDTAGVSRPELSSWCASRDERPEQSTTRSALRSMTLDHHPGHPAAGHGDPVDEHPVLQPDGRQGRDMSPDHVLQQRPGHAEKSAAPDSLRPVAPALKDPGAGSVGRRPPARSSSSSMPGNHPTSRPSPALSSRWMWRPCATCPRGADRVGQSLPFEHDDLVDNVGQGPSGQQARDAGTHDDDRGHDPSVAHRTA